MPASSVIENDPAKTAASNGSKTLVGTTERGHGFVQNSHGTVQIDRFGLWHLYVHCLIKDSFDNLSDALPSIRIEPSLAHSLLKQLSSIKPGSFITLSSL